MDAMRKRPRIALTSPVLATPQSAAARARYVRALEQAGAEVIVVEPGAPVPPDVEGVCFSGGGDIAPERYGTTDEAGVCENLSPERDALELDLAREAVDRDLPMLGICRGFQLLNVAFGGTLIQDVPGHRVDAPIVPHVVTPEPGSRLAAASGDRPLVVNSRHHQAVTAETLAPSLHPTAFVDGLVEAFEGDGKRWIVGVQWHPERQPEDGLDPVVSGVFTAFVAEASRTPIRS